MNGVDEKFDRPDLAGDRYVPGTADDVAEDNPAMLANQLRAAMRDTNARLDSIDQTLKLFARIEMKLDVIVDRQNETDRQVRENAARIVAQSVELAAVVRRVTALEQPKAKRRTTAARKKRP